jgi:hypothetical protein
MGECLSSNVQSTGLEHSNATYMEEILYTITSYYSSDYSFQLSYKKNSIIKKYVNLKLMKKIVYGLKQNLPRDQQRTFNVHYKLLLIIQLNVSKLAAWGNQLVVTNCQQLLLNWGVSEVTASARFATNSVWWWMLSLCAQNYYLTHGSGPPPLRVMCSSRERVSDVGFGALHKEGVNYSAARGLNNSNQVPGVAGMVNPQLSRKVSIESESECARRVLWPNYHPST